jgi:hypothetical protein
MDATRFRPASIVCKEQEVWSIEDDGCGASLFERNLAGTLLRTIGAHKAYIASSKVHHGSAALKLAIPTAER